MPRIERIKHARKSPGTCEVCGVVIRGRVADEQNRTVEMGEPYQTVKPRYGSRRVRHTTCRTWRPSELTSSKMAEVWAAQEAFDESDHDESTIEADVASVVEAARSVAEQYEESASNIEEGFGHETFQSDELRTKGEELNGWADDLESAASDEVFCNVCAEPQESMAHGHDFAASVDDETVCAAVEGCEVAEDDHHEWEPNLDDIVDMVGNCPV